MATRSAPLSVILVTLIFATTQAAKESKGSIWSQLDMQFYSKLKVDASIDDSAVTTGNYVKWVDPEVTGAGSPSIAPPLSSEDDGEFNLTANQSKIGMHVQGPETDTFAGSSRFEVDFYGGGAENSAHFRMRHAYLEFKDKRRNVTLLAGQTCDVMSPLVPYTLNYTVMWFSGNMGYRRPQIRVTKEFACGEGKILNVQAAIARTIDDTLTSTAGSLKGITTESGADAGFPSFQARAGFTFPGCAGRPATIGVSGHWGQEEFDFIDNSTGLFGNSRVDSWSGNVDVLLPLSETCTLKAEAHTGANLDNYCAGIGQGVITTDVTNVRAMRARGGWLALAIAPGGSLRYHLGGGTEKIADGDLAAGDRARNSNIFGNAIYAFNRHASVGAELSYWVTEYWNPASSLLIGDGKDIRAQVSFMFKQ